MNHQCILCSNPLQQIFKGHTLWLNAKFNTYICNKCTYKDITGEFISLVIIDCDQENNIIGYQIDHVELGTRFFSDAEFPTNPKTTELAQITERAKLIKSIKPITIPYIEYNDLKTFFSKEKIDLLMFYA